MAAKRQKDPQRWMAAKRRNVISVFALLLLSFRYSLDVGLSETVRHTPLSCKRWLADWALLAQLLKSR